MLGVQFVLAVIIHGFQFFAAFAMFPIALFVIMELSGYFVLLTTGVRHKERDAAEEELLRQSEQPSSKESAPIVSSTSLDSAWRGTTDVAVETTLRNRAIATGV